LLFRRVLLFFAMWKRSILFIDYTASLHVHLYKSDIKSFGMVVQKYLINLFQSCSRPFHLRHKAQKHIEKLWGEISAFANHPALPVSPAHINSSELVRHIIVSLYQETPFFIRKHTIMGCQIISSKPSNVFKSELCLLGLGQRSNFSCAEPNVNELSSLFHFICIGFGTWKVRRLTVALSLPLLKLRLQSISICGIDKLSTRREEACNKLFSEKANEPDYN
jgi:hypothetical protein